MSNQDSVPAITELDAAGEIAELYADIRQVLGGGVVNLIWRHLATMPGALRWVWSSVRPLYLTLAPAHAETVRRELTLPDIPRHSNETLTAAGISESDLTQIQTVLASYQHTNALALVIFSAMLAYHEPGGAEAGYAAERASPPPGGVMPVLPSMRTLPPWIARLIEELNGFGEDSDAILIASMYRHLAHWPAYLALTRTMLAPLERDGRLRELVRLTRVRGRAHGNVLATHLNPGPPPETATEALAACRRFVEHPIARMTVICAIMRAANPPE
jgi:hypothetical protein